jgi:hypothetical protein
VSRPLLTRPPLALLAAVLALGCAATPSLAAEKTKPTKASAGAIQVLPVDSDEVKLPPEFQMALYENLLGTLQKTGSFKQVFRAGDHGADSVADLATLHTNVRGFKEGSARARQVTTVAGATSIKVHIQITARDGKTLFERDVEGKVHFFGENLRATYNLAKAVAKQVKENFQSASPAATRGGAK